MDMLVYFFGFVLSSIMIATILTLTLVICLLIVRFPLCEIVGSEFKLWPSFAYIGLITCIIMYRAIS